MELKKAQLLQDRREEKRNIVYDHQARIAAKLTWLCTQNANRFVETTVVVSVETESERLAKHAKVICEFESGMESPQLLRL